MVAVPAGFYDVIFTGSEVPIHYQEGPPNGPDLLLLHGLARDCNSFSVLLPALAPKFHVFVLDLRGHGASGRAAREYTIPQFASDVSALLSAHCAGGAAIFGHSLGAMVGMYVASLADCKVNALIVGDSMISPENLARSPYHSLFTQLRKLIQGEGSQQDLAYRIGKIQIHLPGIDEPLALEDLAGNTPSVLLEWARSAYCTDPDALAMSLDGSAFKRWNPHEVLPRITCPVLLLQGNPDLDALLSDSDVELARGLLPQSEHVKFPLLGHALFMQQSQPVIKEMLRFLGTHRLTGGT